MTPSDSFFRGALCSTYARNPLLSRVFFHFQSLSLSLARLHFIVGKTGSAGAARRRVQLNALVAHHRARLCATRHLHFFSFE